MSEKKLPAKTFPPEALAALRRGDAGGLLTALGPAGPEREAQLAQLALELRRESVAVIGSHEAFVRHTNTGSLLQVIRPVRLALADRTLYQMTTKRPYFKGTNEIAPRGTDKNRVEWRSVPVTPGVAELTYQGYMRVNAVAGCAVVQPATVVVDGERRTNPYVERVPTANGRLGDIQRIVVGVAVVGPTPATGTPVAVTYTLDYDPAKDLQHMLAQLAEDEPEECYLVDDESGYEKRAGWKYTPLHGGVGFYYNLRNKAVIAIMADFVNLLQNAMKKASTVARRNAMRNHPALGVQSVCIDDQGVALLPVVGWAGDQQAADRWASLMAQLARGQDVQDQVQTITLEPEAYDPSKHNNATPDAARPVEEADPAAAERNRLIAQIDEGLNLLGPAQVAGLGYRPEAASVEELRATLARMNSMLDDGGES